MGKIRPYDVYERYAPPDDWPLLMTSFFSFLGGVFGLYDGRMDSLITQSVEGTKQVSYWGDINDPLRC